MRNRLILVCLFAAAWLCACHSGPKIPDLESGEERNQRLNEAMQLYRQGVAEDKAKHYDKAMQLYRESIAKNPDLGPAWNNLGRLMMETGDYVGAQQYLLRAADLSVTDPRPYENLGLVYSRAQWKEDALKYYGLALERDPNSLNALRGAIAAAMDLNKINEETKDRLKRVLLIETDPQWRREFELFKLRVENEMNQAKRKEPKAHDGY